MRGGSEEEAEAVEPETQTEAKARACGSSCGSGSVCEESGAALRCYKAAGAGGVPAGVGRYKGAIRQRKAGPAMT